MFELSHLRDLQNEIKNKGLKAYLIVMSDPHASEYVASRFSAERLFFCPFTGDAGQLLVTEDNAYLFTDGRFFIQAEKELASYPFVLMRIGEKNVPSLTDFIKEKDLYPLGVNTLNISENFYKTIALKDKKVVDVDYAQKFIKNRPSLSKEKIYELDSKLNSLTYKEKIDAICLEMNKIGVEANLITTLDDIAYILNMRGKDIECNPVFYSYLYVSHVHGTHLFIDLDKLDYRLEGVEVHPYDEITSFLKEHRNVRTLVDSSKVNAKLFNILSNPIEGKNPSYLMKSIKGEIEIKNTKEIQELDGVALVKFIDFLNKNIEKNLTEYQYAEELKKYRLENERCFDLSFGTIAAVGANAAEMHYSPSEEKSSVVSSSSQELLVDSGGQYYGGTTDTTRTFAIGKELSSEYIHDYTLTLKSVIALSTSIFMRESTGQTLDIKAREIMWKEGMDYKCGTGHGVGYILNVHEGPNGFRYKRVAERDDGNMLVPGMITTVEPGVYKQDKYGIRIENNLLCVPAFETDMGVFYKFETITYVPIDTRALDLSIMTDEEITWLNDYHKMVFEHLSSHMSSELIEVLGELTKPIKR